MGKKEKTKKDEDRKPFAGKEGKGARSTRIMVAALVVAVLFAIAAFVVVADRAGEKGRSFLVAGGEDRPLLDPSQFTGMIKDAYTVAAKYPQIMDKLYCYCLCQQPPFNHKSLLSCFVSIHGANCTICIQEALWAARLHEEGKPLDEIRRKIDKEFGKREK